MSTDSKVKKYEDVLMAALNFTEDDRAANEAGSLSVGQVSTLQQQRTRQIRSITLMCAFVLALALFVMVAVTLATVPMLAFIVLFMVVATVNGTRSIQRLNHDLQANVEAVEGRIELDLRSAEDGSGNYFVWLDGRKFKVQRDGFLAFKNGDPYRLYYTPHTKMILSVDWLRDDDPFVAVEERRPSSTPADSENALQSFTPAANERRSRTR